MGTAGTTASWHNIYKDSAWIFVGGLDYDLTEGDIITVFSQYGEIVNVNLVRDRKSGKSKGFAFICYEDQRSTILAVDNLNTIKLAGKIIRVDHVQNYKVPKQTDDLDEETKKLFEEGCAPQPVPLNPVKVKSEKDIKREKSEDTSSTSKKKKHKKDKKRHKDKKKHKKHHKDKSRRDEGREVRDSSSPSSESDGKRQSHHRRKEETDKRKDHHRHNESDRRRYRSRSPR